MMKTRVCTNAHPFGMGFSLLRTLQFFVFRKMKMPETKSEAKGRGAYEITKLE